MYMDAADMSSASESRWNDQDRPPTTPEPPRESASPPVDFPSETSGVLKRKGSRRPRNQLFPEGLAFWRRIPHLQQVKNDPCVGRCRSTSPISNLVLHLPGNIRPLNVEPVRSGLFVVIVAQEPPALSRSASFFGLIGNHRRNKSIRADSLADESFGNITSPPALPPLPSTPRTPRPKSPPAAESKIIIGDRPPVLPSLPPIDIELSPPSPPRLLASASQPVQSAPTSFMVLSQHFLGIAANSSPSRSPGATSSLGRANGLTLLAGNSSGSMRRSSLGDLKIPARISRNQVALKSNLTMVREFAAIVESEW
ncbi:hypothetical protein FRC00_014637 [Tulasnella sp. 408]|nr:hypothetical protein FRC00_014637 [Tulasnella sp. 408]